jgi:hypothetical protein
MTRTDASRRPASRAYGEDLCVWILRREGTELVEEDVVAFDFPMTVTGKAQKFLSRSS